MKKPLPHLIVRACVVFTSMIVASLLIVYVAIGPNEGLNRITSLLFISILLVVQQWLWFTVIMTERLALRMIGSVATLVPPLFLCGWFGGWLPQAFGAVVPFGIVFVLVLAIVYVIYALRYRRKALEREQILKDYRRKQK